MGDHLVKVQILLAAFNGETYLPAQLDSLSAQTFSDFQVLYQDDGSSDRTVRLLADRSRLDPRFVPGTHQGEHLGAAGNFLSLIRQSDADYILLCDQDDVWEPEKVSVLLSACMDAEKDIPSGMPLLVHSDAYLIDQNGNRIAPSFFRLQGWDPGAVTLNRLLVQNNSTGCLMLLNRPLADLVSRFGDPDKMFMHDWFIALTAASFGRIRFVSRQMTGYRQHQDNEIGASRASLPRRGAAALRNRSKGKARIRLTYTNAQNLRDAFGDACPADSAEIIDRYLASRSYPKLKRILFLRRGGYLMQNPVTRLGQYLFG